MNRSMAAVICILLLCVAVQGCVKDTAELEQAILAQDPSFRDVLDTRDSLRDQLDAQRAAYEKKKDGIDSRIAALKEQRDLARQEYVSSAGKIKRQIEPVKRRLRRDLVDMQRELDRKKREQKEIARDIDEIRSLIDKKDTLAFTQEEMRTWNERLAGLIRKKETIASDAEKLDQEIELTKKKTRVVGL